MVEGIQVEDFGGDIPAVHVSGLTGEGLPELLETLSLIAEMQDLRAEHTGPVYGHVLESNVQKGLGYVLTFFQWRRKLYSRYVVLWRLF
jgi:translation initiation factor IF-2